MTCFPPDTRLPAEVIASPNHGERRSGVRPDMIVLHYTGMPTAEAALQRLCTPHSEVSTHYLVFEDGGLVQCVPEGRRAWHAGAASWRGITDINSHSIGIEIVNPGHDHGYREFPRAQIETVIALCADIISRRGIPADRVLAHSDVAPVRKQDPGEKFPWRTLHAAGIGHWVEPAPLDTPGSVVHPGDSGATVERLQQAVRDYGYALAENGRYGAETESVVRAFQRHFRPERVDGIADPSTRTTLQRLLTARGMSSQV